MHAPLTPAEVRAIRERLGLTQLQLAAEVGVTEHSVWRWENGMHPVSLPTAMLLRRIDAERSVAVPA